MKLKNKLFILGAVVAMATPAFAVIGCSSDKQSDFITDEFRNSLSQHEFTDINHEYTYKELKTRGIVHDAILKKWIDGDTPTVSNISPEIDGNSESNIRIQAIDTPELHVSDGHGHINVLTKGKELEYATKAKVFGESQMPSGTAIKLLSNGDESYNRIVGSLFYQVDKNQNPNDDDTLYKSYATRILKEGLCLPFASPKQIGLPNVIDLLASSLADSYNWAIKNRKGMFSEKVNDILGVHGATDDSPWRWRAEKPSGEPANAYECIAAFSN